MSLASFGVRKPVPVNLLMIAVTIAGLYAAWGLRREFFPQQNPDSALLTMPYPGATPEEVEDALAIKVENKLADLDEVDEISTSLAEGGGVITIKFREGLDARRALDEVDRAIDTLQDLPEEAEEITTQLLEPRLPVIRLAVYGDLDEEVLKRIVRGVRDDLISLPNMGEVLIDGVRDYEIRVDVRQDALLAQGLSLPQVADAVDAWMREVPGGTVRNVGGNVKVRTMGVPERASAIRGIVLRSDAQGRSVTLGDIATVREAFVDEQIINRFNARETAPGSKTASGNDAASETSGGQTSGGEMVGQPAAVLTVFAVGEQDIVNIAKMVRNYVRARNGQPFDGGVIAAKFGSDPLTAWELGHASSTPLPPGADIATTSDLARFVEGRLDLLLNDGWVGALLVVLTLLVFLNWRAALWVGVGLLFAIFGTLALMMALGITLNLLTMFGLIIVLGLMVDDAIVIVENIQTRHDRGEPSDQAAIAGTEELGWPVIATVLTTTVAFLPLMLIKGQIGDLLGALPLVVACALFMSLVESLLTLPSHMAVSLAGRDRAASRQTRAAAFIKRLEARRDHLFHERIVNAYARFLGFALRYRYLSLLVTLCVFGVSVAMVAGGRVNFTFLDDSDAETVLVDVRMPIGTPLEVTDAAVAAIERAAFAQPEVSSIASVVGQRADIDTGNADAAATHIGQMFVELYHVEDRTRSSAQVVASIREQLDGGPVGIDRLRFTEISGGPGGADVTIRVRGERAGQVDAAVADVKEMLRHFEGVVDISDDNDLGQAEARIVPRASDIRSVGMTPLDVASQVRGFLFGIDAHTYADYQEDIDVRVRLDAETRRDLHLIENAWLVTPAGQRVPLSEVADVEDATTYATIKRVDRQRSVTVTADTVPSLSPEDVTARLDLGTIRAAYPGVSVEYAGRQEQLADAFASLPLGMAAAGLMIYVILAWLFSSYFQPLVVMVAIPFSIVGVVWGHYLLGFDLTFLSLIGFIALSGVVVNDSLIFVEFYNHSRRSGTPLHDALIEAGRARLRPILITTLTSVFSLLPFVLEQSFQARFLIPMAITLSMGLAAAAVLVLTIMPCIMLIFDDIHRGAYRLWHGRRMERGERHLFNSADHTP